jgi:Zn-dependent M28 family amino/carboxypeptidase
MKKTILIVLLIIFFILVGGELFMIKMPGQSYKGLLPSLTQQEREVEANLRQHIQILAGEIGERNLWQYKALQAGKDYIKKSFEAIPGYTVSEHSYQLNGLTSTNIIAEKLGASAPDKIIIIGAHYDSVVGSPGADDNASGVAGILEMARLMSSQSFPYTIRFVAFTNEEPPFFLSSKMGSYQYAKTIKSKKENVIAMFSIESIGYYDDAKNSQRYPFPFGFFYPDQGNFIGFVGNVSSRQLVHHTIQAFRENVKFPSEGYAGPAIVPGVNWSDQWSFWRFGYKAIMITDSALYRNPNYHTAFDKPETVDYQRAARVVVGLAHMFATSDVIARLGGG